jgi:hypothetical protein
MAMEGNGSHWSGAGDRLEAGPTLEPPERRGQCRDAPRRIWRIFIEVKEAFIKLMALKT